MNPKKQEKYIITLEDWYPTHNSHVRVFLCPDWSETQRRKTTHIWGTKGNWRVAIWGNDDFGLEKVFDNYQDARRCYMINCVDYITQKELKEIGFVNA